LIEESLVSSRQGKQALEGLAASVHKVTELARQMHGLVNSVDDGNEQQSRSVEAISRALGQMEQTTQSVAACAEENAAAGEELSAQTQMLDRIADRLSEMIGSVR
jgi:methyl-accepting chemotaxis protein